MMLNVFRSSLLCLVCIGSLASTSAPQSATQSTAHQELGGMFFGGSGGELLKRCSAVGTLRAGATVAPLQLADTVKDSNLCWGYIAGVIDEYQANTLSSKKPPVVCLPHEVDMEQLEKVVKKSLDDNPARLHMPAFVLIVDALGEAFPCKKRY